MKYARRCMSVLRACVCVREGGRETISAKIWSLHLSRIKALCDIKSKIWILEYYFGGTRVSCTSRSEGRWAPLEMPALCWGVLEVTRACSWHRSQAHLSRSQKISFASILGLFSSAATQGDQHRRKRWGTGKKAASAGILFLQEQIKEIIIIVLHHNAPRGRSGPLCLLPRAVSCCCPHRCRTAGPRPRLLNASCDGRGAIIGAAPRR